MFSKIRLGCVTSLTIVVMFIGTSKFSYAATMESAVKAGVIYNFAKYIEWPESMDMYATFNICHMGDNRLEDSLQALQGKLIGDKHISVKQNIKREDFNSCQILFIAEDDDQETYKLLHDIGNAPIVTVSDSPEFVLKGGMIGIIRDGSRVGFEVNLAPANVKDLHFSSQLLKLAKTVRGLE